jgi:hypothetical protein
LLNASQIAGSGSVWSKVLGWTHAICFSRDHCLCSTFHLFYYVLCSACEYAMFIPAQRLHDLSNSPESKVTLAEVLWEVRRIYYTVVDLLLISFLYHSMWLLLGWISNGTSCIKLWTKNVTTDTDMYKRIQYLNKSLLAYYKERTVAPRVGLCCELATYWQIFQKLPYSNIICWNSM